MSWRGLVRAHDSRYQTRAGWYTLDMTFVNANKSMKLDGGAGFDHLEKHQMPFIRNLTIQNWENINGYFVKRLNPNTPINGVFVASP